jgi:catechol 2,3-dioxygenase-like lactoylglutathione lyase family enzyme
MRATAVTVGIPVRDLEKSVAWYSTALAKDGPDLRPMDDLAEFDLGAFWLQLVAAASRAGVAGSSINIGVADAVAERERLHGLGFEVSPIERYEGVVLYFELIDPDGNRLGFVEELTA